MTQKLIKTDDYWIVPIQNQVVFRCCIGYAFEIQIQDSINETTIKIEDHFLIKKGDETIALTFEEGQTSLGPALAILHASIQNAKAYESGRLEIDFSGDIQLIVEADTQYEAWELVGNNGLRLVCMPGGDLAVWSPG